jgi:capsular polysaccharide export protein
LPARFQPNDVSAQASTRHDLAGLAGRRFLIVSAPFGSFSRHLANLLRQHGAVVDRMLFNLGDLAEWGPENARWFRKPAQAWPAAFADLAKGYSDIMLFGEAGLYNQAVVEAIPTIDASVWVMENGYFRPHWVTLERNGVNDRSNLPRSADGYPAPAPKEPPFRHAGTILPYHVVNLSLYHSIQVMGRPFFPGFKRPYSHHAFLQCLGHIARFIRLKAAPKNAADHAVIAARGPFFIACLQREGDATLLHYSDLRSNHDFVAHILDSMAAHAPPDARLVVKNHPLDPGVIDLGAQVRRLAAARGLADRVDFIDGGNLAQLCRASRGVIVNNSTAALAAAGFGTPVKVLGKAFFDFEGLTDQKPLDSFWTAPQAADPALFARFREHVLHRTQINGSFHTPDMRAFTCHRIALALAGGWDRAQTDWRQP